MKAAQRQFLWSVAGISTPFAQKSGGEVTSDATKVWDGGSITPDVIAAPAEVGDVTLTRPYDPERDQPVLDRLIGLVGQWRTTISGQPLTGDMSSARVKPRVYPNALLVGVREPEHDAGSGDGADYELTFAVGSVA
ncbi:MAG: hypothetical protein HOY78_02420 [Saccharothrix sp.]|nr:hypothetical protein [Saccharothrix sp.]